ncbi:MAG: hypothetical protein R3D55_11810 [Chloroflexota bacterium]
MIIHLNQMQPKALILDHPEHGIPATAEIIGPWLEEGEAVGQLLRFAGEHSQRHLRHDEIAALQMGDEIGTEIRIKRQGHFYFYGRRELGLAIVSEATISRQRALEIYSNNQDGTAAHITGEVDFGARPCRWSWAITFSEGMDD